MNTTLSDVEKLFDKLKLSLALNDSNNQAFELGGNCSELFFLLTHNVTVFPADKTSFFRAGSSGIQFNIEGSASIKELRKELTEFIATHPDKLSLSKEEVKDLSFLKNMEIATFDMKILVKAVEEVQILVKSLDTKLTLQQSIGKVFNEEIDVIKLAFLKEMNLPKNLFDLKSSNRNTKEYFSAIRMMKAHPVWGPKYKEIKDRLDKIEELLLGKEELGKLESLTSLPPYITLFVIRNYIGLERMVNLSLDERCKLLDESLVKFNKELE